MDKILKIFAYKLLLIILSSFLLSNSINREVPGDVNGDGVVDVVDIVYLVNDILNNDFSNNGDINNDGYVNILDIVAIVNIIFDDTDIPQPGENAYGSLNSFDIITWNIENFPKNNTTVDTLSTIIPELFIDIIALQEIESTSSLNSLRNQLGDNWISYIAEENSSWGELSYLVNTNEVEINEPPFTILNQYEYYFAYRPPFVLNITYQNDDYVIINVHYKCCDGSEDRRLQASIYLENYINLYHSNDNVIVLGDFNDLLIDNPNVFTPFLNQSNLYEFADYYISQIDMIDQWSFPGWPSDLDHILITDELFNVNYQSNTLLIDETFFNSMYNYDNHISDHRPVGIRFFY